MTSVVPTLAEVGEALTAVRVLPEMEAEYQARRRQQSDDVQSWLRRKHLADNVEANYSERAIRLHRLHVTGSRLLTRLDDMVGDVDVLDPQYGDLEFDAEHEPQLWGAIAFVLVDVGKLFMAVFRYLEAITVVGTRFWLGEEMTAGWFDDIMGERQPPEEFGNRMVVSRFDSQPESEGRYAQVRTARYALKRKGAEVLGLLEIERERLLRLMPAEAEPRAKALNAERVREHRQRAKQGLHSVRGLVVGEPTIKALRNLGYLPAEFDAEDLRTALAVYLRVSLSSTDLPD